MSNSRISGLYRLSVNDRIGELVKRGFLSRDAAKALLDGAPLLPLSTADRMAENVIGVFGLPFGIAPNFLVNDKDYLVPMAIEEPSVIAAASNAARMAREHGGFTATDTGPNMIAQIQVVDVLHPENARTKIMEVKDELLAFANEQDPILV